jgi:hypothetical protein
MVTGLIYFLIQITHSGGSDAIYTWQYTLKA